MEKIRISQAFTMFLLVLGIYASISLTHGPIVFFKASAQPGIEIQAWRSGDLLHERSAGGAIYYVQKGFTENLQFVATTELGAELSYLGMQVPYFRNSLPNGFEVSTLSTPTGDQITISIDPTQIDIPDERLPAGYGIIFNSTLPSDDPTQTVSSYAETIFVIEPTGERPSSRISFDKTVYSFSADSGSVDMIVTVTDPHVDCNNVDREPTPIGPLNAVPDGAANPNNLDPNHPMWIRISAWFDSENPSDMRFFYLPRDLYGNNNFRGAISVIPSDSVMGSMIEGRSVNLNVRYDAFENSIDPRSPNELCVMPHNDRLQELKVVQTTVLESNISFDKLTYSSSDALGQTDSGFIRVSDSEATGDNVRVRIASDIAPGEIVIDLPREQTGGASFSRPISFTQTEPTSVPANPTEMVLFNVATNPIEPRVVSVMAMYHRTSPDPNQPLATAVATTSILPIRKLSFDDDRLSYAANELAKLVLKDPNSNTNANEFERPIVTICSYSYPEAPSANYEFLHTADIQLAESNRNSGEFVSSYYIRFTNNTYTDDQYLRDNNLHHPENATLLADLRRNAVLISEAGQTLVYATLGGQCIMPVISTVSQIEGDVLTAVTTIEPAVAVAVGDPGAGGSETSATHESPPLYSLDTITCDQLDYGPDTDGDGICDGWEDGSSLRIPYPAGGSKYTISNACSPSCPTSTEKDVFVEIDYINNLSSSPACADPQYNVSYRPNDLAISNVVSAFSNYGINLHIQVGEDVGGTVCRTTFNVWGDGDGGTNSYDEMKKSFFGFTSPYSERLTTDRGKAKYQVFHYGIFGSRQAGAAGSSGVSEQIGNDFIVTLGNPTFQYNNIDQQQGTLMHELGHNLGLYHGGPDDGVNDHTVNCKPNYPSVMSYIRQYTNTYDNATLRYSDDNFQTNIVGNNRRISSQDPGEVDVLKLTSGSALNSVELVWGIYVGGVWVAVDNDLAAGDDPVAGDVSKSWSDIDWNHNDAISDATDPPGDYIIKLGITGCTTGDDGWIYGADDWANLELDFRNLNAATFTSGFGHPESYPQEMNNVTLKDIRLAGIRTLSYEIATLDDQDFNGNSTAIKNDFNNTLFADSASVAALLNADSLDEAIDKLLGIRKYMDGNAGGDKTDDLLVHEPPESGGGVDFSRTVLPIPPQPGSDIETILGSSSITTLIITDPDRNMSGVEDTIDFIFEDDALANQPSFRVAINAHANENDEIISSLAEYSGSLLEDILPGLNNFTLNESGSTTGVFDEELEFEFGSLDPDEWRGLQVNVIYIDSNGTEFDGGISFRAYDAITNATPISVANNATITVTVEDGDLNLDDGDVEEFDSVVGTGGTFLVSVDTEDDHIAGTTVETFRETGEDSGIFEASWQVGQDIPLVGNGTEATRIAITYNEEVDFNGTAKMHEIDIPIVGSTAIMQTLPDLVGPSTKVTVLVTDTDLDQDPGSTDEYTPIDPDADNFFVNFQSDRNEVGEASPSLEETGPNTGTFTFMLDLVTDETACQDDNLSSDPDLDASGGSEPSMGVCPGDIISIRYEDDQDSSGNSVIVSETIEVLSWDPEFTSDRNSYDVGDVITIRIDDPDANRDPQIEDILTGVRVTSDSDSVGEQFAAAETGSSTGIFSFTFLTSPSVGSGAITVNEGDDVMIEYTDDFPADFADENEDKDFTFTVSLASGGGSQSGAITADGGGGSLPSGGVTGSGPADKGSESDPLIRVKNVLRILDNNIASLKVATNLPFDQHAPFEITSFDVDCDKSDEDMDECTIVGYSDSVTSVADTFRIDNVSKTMKWDFIGQGSVELHIPIELATYISEVKSARNGMLYDFNSTTDGNATIVNLDALSYYPRLLTVGYDESNLPIKVSDPEIRECKSIAPCIDDDEINRGDNIVVLVPITNTIDETLVCTAITDIRDAQGVTVAIYWQPCTTPHGGIGPNDSAIISTDLKPDELGNYQIVTVIVDNLEHTSSLLGFDRHMLPPVV